MCSFKPATLSFRDERARWEWPKRTVPLDRRASRARAWGIPEGQAGWGECSRRDGSGTDSLPRRMEDVYEEEMNSNTDRMYIHVCHVSCSVVVMFTCTLVRRYPDSRRRKA